MNARRMLTVLLTAALFFGCQMESTAPEQHLTSTTDCGACPPIPATGDAYFTLSEPEFFATSDSFEVALRVSATDNITFSQFTVDFHSDCLQFRGAIRSASLPGSDLFVNDGPATPAFPVNDPDSDRHVLVNLTASYGPECQREVVRLRFRVISPGPALCWLRWDTSVPGGNPPNHLVTSTPSLILPTNIQFCDRPVFFRRSTDCQCASPPPLGSADFSIGSPQFTGPGQFEVGLLVNTSEAIAFSQFTVDYRSDCLQFLGATRGGSLPSGSMPFINDGAGTPAFPIDNPGFDRHVLTNIPATYGPGCQLEIVRLQFRFVGPAPATCELRWDDSSPAANPPNHLVTGEPSQIRPETIYFCDSDIEFRSPEQFTLLVLVDTKRGWRPDQLAMIPDPLTGVANVIGSLGDSFRHTESIATRIVPGSQTRVFAIHGEFLIEIDPMTGSPTPVGPIGCCDVEGIAFHPQTGLLYGVTNTTNKILAIDIDTGRCTVQRDNVGDGYRLDDITFHPITGEAYVLAEDCVRLIKVDLATGAETHWRIIGAKSLESLLWSRDGTILFSAADRQSFKDLVTIDLSTSTVAFVAPIHSGLKEIEGLAWIERDRLPPATWAGAIPRGQ